MSDHTASWSPFGGLQARFSLRRALVYAGTSAYCLALFLAFDFAYSSGIARSLQNMRALSDLLAAKNVPLSIVVYPWAQQLAQGDRNSK